MKDKTVPGEVLQRLLKADINEHPSVELGRVHLIENVQSIVDPLSG